MIIMQVGLVLNATTSTDYIEITIVFVNMANILVKLDIETA